VPRSRTSLGLPTAPLVLATPGAGGSVPPPASLSRRPATPTYAGLRLARAALALRNRAPGALPAAPKGRGRLSLRAPPPRSLSATCPGHLAAAPQAAHKLSGATPRFGVGAQRPKPTARLSSTSAPRRCFRPRPQTTKPPAYGSRSRAPKVPSASAPRARHPAAGRRPRYGSAILRAPPPPSHATARRARGCQRPEAAPAVMLTALGRAPIPRLSGCWPATSCTGAFCLSPAWPLRGIALLSGEGVSSNRVGKLERMDRSTGGRGELERPKTARCPPTPGVLLGSGLPVPSHPRPWRLPPASGALKLSGRNCGVSVRARRPRPPRSHARSRRRQRPRATARLSLAEPPRAELALGDRASTRRQSAAGGRLNSASALRRCPRSRPRPRNQPGDCCVSRSPPPPFAIARRALGQQRPKASGPRHAKTAVSARDRPSSRPAPNASHAIAQGASGPVLRSHRADRTPV
jgi:hypothetical protein